MTDRRLEELEEQYKVLGEKIEELKLEKSTNSDKYEILEYANSLYKRPGKVEWQGNYLKIPLPTSNTRWTFEVWDIVKVLQDKYDDLDIDKYCYPVFEPGHDNTNYQYVKFSGFD